MKILHTSDWHVGKVLKGRDRHDEQVAVLASIVATAREEDVDLVLVAGDLFETSAPTAKSQGLVMRTLLALREDSRQVVVIAGNHDNGGLIDSVYRPVLGQLGLTVLGLPKRPESGGTTSFNLRNGETARVAALPFLSHRYAVRAAEIVLHEFAEHTLDYSRLVAIARSLREQVDWPGLWARTSGSPYARAFRTLVEGLDIEPPPDARRARGHTHVRVIGERAPGTTRLDEATRPSQ